MDVSRRLAVGGDRRGVRVAGVYAASTRFVVPHGSRRATF